MKVLFLIIFICNLTTLVGQSFLVKFLNTPYEYIPKIKHDIKHPDAICIDKLYKANRILKENIIPDTCNWENPNYFNGQGRGIKCALSDICSSNADGLLGFTILIDSTNSRNGYQSSYLNFNFVFNKYHDILIYSEGNINYQSSQFYAFNPDNGDNVTDNVFPIITITDFFKDEDLVGAKNSIPLELYKIWTEKFQYEVCNPYCIDDGIHSYKNTLFTVFMSDFTMDWELTQFIESSEEYYNEFANFKPPTPTYYLKIIWIEKEKKFEAIKVEIHGNLNTEEFILKCPENYKQEVKQIIEYKREEWKNVTNPFIATYEGNDFGDYHHINFKDSNGERYDFGFGKNDFGDIQLYNDDEQMSDNPKYLGKSFKIFWEWKISSFPCCSGEYEIVEAYLPSIIKLELVESNSKKK